MVLSWYENRPAKEIPPRWMWMFDAELEAWFKRVDEERSKGHASGSSGSDSSAAPMVQNELTKGMR